MIKKFWLSLGLALALSVGTVGPAHADDINSEPPSGTAGGCLAGDYPNPTFAATCVPATATPIPPVATATPAPTDVPIPATSTPKPDATRVPTDTPAPTSTPANTPVPAETCAAYVIEVGTGSPGGQCSGRAESAQGVAVTAANNLTLGTDGNYFILNGATQVNGICNTNWQGGSVIYLYVNNGLSFNNDSGSLSGCFKPFWFPAASGGAFPVASTHTVAFVYDSFDTHWHLVDSQPTPVASATPPPTPTPISGGIVCNVYAMLDVDPNGNPNCDIAAFPYGKNLSLSGATDLNLDNGSGGFYGNYNVITVSASATINDIEYTAGGSPLPAGTPLYLQIAAVSGARTLTLKNLASPITNYGAIKTATGADIVYTSPTVITLILDSSGSTWVQESIGPTVTPAATSTPANTPVSTATAVSTPTPPNTPVPTATAVSTPTPLPTTHYLWTGRVIKVPGDTSYAVTAGTSAIYVRMVGGGGGGGGGVSTASTNSGVGGGGGSSGYCEFWRTTLDSPYTLQIGTGGGGGSGNAAGGTGSLTTTWGDSGGTQVAINAGNGGNSMAAAGTANTFTAGGPGGTVTTSAYANITCSPGSGGILGLRVSAAITMPGTGGSNPLGAGGGNSSTSATGTNSPGRAGGPGAGGSGAAIAGQNGSVTGGAGGDGRVLIDEYTTR